MKKMASLAFLSLFILTGPVYAQYTATWALTTNKTVTVSGSQAANVVASAMVPGATFSAGAHNTDGFACSYTTAWPTVATDGMNLDFPLSPDAASNLTITGLTFGVKISGSSGNQSFSLAYQVDGAGSWIALGSPVEATSGGSSSVTFGTLAGSFENGHTYVLRLYVYAKASGTSSSRKAYIKNIAFTGAVTTANTPVINLSASSLATFGTLLVGTSSAAQSYTVSGMRLTDNITVSAPASFQVSTDNISYADNVTLIQSGGVLGSSTVYVKLSPATAVGTVTASISHQSPGAITKTVAVDGKVLAVEPTTQSVLTFGEVTGKSIVVNAAPGNGSKRIIVIHADNSVSYSPMDGVAETGVNNDYETATDKGNGNKVVYDGTGTTVLVTGLVSGKTYYFNCFEYNEGTNNSQNYYTTNPGTGSQMTLQVPSLSVGSASLSFGSLLYNTVSSEKSYTLSGNFLSPSDGVIGIAAPAGFDISTVSGSGFDTVASISYSGGAINAVPVYVRFKPVEVKSYSGSITNAGGGADAVSVAVSGKGLLEIANSGHYDYVVAADGSGDFKTIQEAVDAVPATNAKWIAILVKNGSYNSHLAINKPFVAIVGESRENTRIELDLPRTAWASEHGTNTGCGVVNVAASDSMVIIANMTIINTHTSGSDYTEAFRSEGLSTKLWFVNCTIWATYSDTFSPWGKANGRYYAANCSFKGGIDAVCPRGWCYMIDCEFIECQDSSPIWHEGIAGLDQKFVIQNGVVRSTKNKGIKLQNAQGSASQFFYIDCLLSDSVASLGAGSPAYFWNCHRTGTTGDASWFSSNNLSSASGSPSHTAVNAAWVFGGAWDPENEMPPVLQYASMPQPFNKQYDVDIQTELKWAGACEAVSYNVYFGTTTTPAFVGNQVVCSYSPGSLTKGQTYYWRVDAVNGEKVVAGNLWKFTVAGITNINDNAVMPKAFSLDQNYPNPFNPATVIKYAVPTTGNIVLKVFDVLGKEVATLVNEVKSAGTYVCEFNAANLSSGLYIYTIKSGNNFQSKKMLLIK